MAVANSSPDAPKGTQAITRALDVLECFIDRNDLGITDLARESGLSASTVHRIVRALLARGYLEQDSANERYHLGRSAVVLGQAGRRKLGVDHALPILRRFSRETGESVNLGLLDHSHVVVALRVVSPQPLRFDQPVGSRIPVHCSSMGKALLAFDAPNGPTVLSELSLDGLTPNSITSVELLRTELDQVRRQGFSLDAEESILGVSCIGAPILDGTGRAVAAIAIQAPTARMTSNREELLQGRIIEVAAEIAQELHVDDAGITPTLPSRSQG